MLQNIKKLLQGSHEDILVFELVYMTLQLFIVFFDKEVMVRLTLKCKYSNYESGKMLSEMYNSGQNPVY